MSQENKPTVSEAIIAIDQVLSQAVLTRQQHEYVAACLRVLGERLSETEQCQKHSS